MAVKLRVGSYHQKAALEQNSSIRWTARGRSITVTAQKALVSKSDVTTASHLIPFAGRTEPVRQEEFVRQLEAMLPAFIGLAFPSLPGKMGHDDPFARAANTATH
jgi:hypothetical protein